MIRLLVKKMIPQRARWEETQKLATIAKLTSHEDAEFYKKELHNKYHSYGYDTYIELLQEVINALSSGAYMRINREQIVAVARVKVLT